MTLLRVDGLTFTFPSSGWSAAKYDEWSFYRKQFGGMRNGIKAVDLVALESGVTAWFIEVKDYRNHARTKPTDVSDEVFEKVLHTLAALLPARANASEQDEQTMASAILRATRLRVVLHLEQPIKHSRVRPRAISAVDVTQKLRRLLKPIDAHPFVAEMSAMGSLQWRVQ